MLLSDSDIRQHINSGHIGIDPLDKAMIQPSSYDVCLDSSFRIFENHGHTHIDPRIEQRNLATLFRVADDEAYVLHPGEFVLGSTVETVAMPDDLAARLEGKSSLGRLGLVVHSTAGFIDPGFEGTITLELSNINTLPIKLWPGMAIGQLCFFQLSSPAVYPYGSEANGSKYQNQHGPTASRSHRNFTRPVAT